MTKRQKLIIKTILEMMGIIVLGFLLAGWTESFIELEKGSFVRSLFYAVWGGLLGLIAAQIWIWRTDS